jgi:ethanolamine ammonia-lyase small subunit
MTSLRDLTPARVALGRAGDSVPTGPLLNFRLAHARARDAVRFPLDAGSLQNEIIHHGWSSRLLRTEAKTRDEYLRRPDLGRRLDAESAAHLAPIDDECPVAVVIADGLSALAVHRHALPLLERLLPELEIKQLWIVQQGRVAVGDHVGELLGARMSLVILGERPGLSTPDSLGAYLTWEPRIGKTDAARNCVSNIHAQGLTCDAAAHKLLFLISESRRRKLSGVALKESADKLLNSA